MSYHLEKLEDEELIAVAGTRYSEKGQEMKVYEPPEDLLVLFVGTQERKDSLRALVKRLLPTIGILALGERRCPVIPRARRRVGNRLTHLRRERRLRRWER